MSANANTSVWIANTKSLSPSGELCSAFLAYCRARDIVELAIRIRTGLVVHRLGSSSGCHGDLGALVRRELVSTPIHLK